VQVYNIIIAQGEGGAGVRDKIHNEIITHAALGKRDHPLQSGRHIDRRLRTGSFNITDSQAANYHGGQGNFPDYSHKCHRIAFHK
jgi:hypothetical protein